MSNQNDAWINEAWEKTVEKVKKTSVQLGSSFPSKTVDGKYEICDDYWRWVVAFWPGLLWLLYEESGHEPFKSIAIECEEKMDEALHDYENLHHDVGFMWELTSIKNYNLTGNKTSRKRALIAASHLASRFNIKGSFMQAWNINDVNDADVLGLSIIDSTMNLPLLYWASKELGTPRFKHIAMAQTKTVLNNFVREDGSVNHMVVFDPENGNKLHSVGGQGYSETSAWSRGASWALHGLTLGYEHTNEEEYLEGAKKVADFFIENLSEDNIPAWDFRAPVDQRDASDTSAAACAASGLLSLSKHVSDEESKIYFEAGKRIIKAVYEKYGTYNDDDEQGIILGGTFNYPLGLGINVSLIYGDYYFVEALYKLKRGEKNAN